MAVLAMHPVDSDHAVCATGAAVYATRDFSDINRDEPTRWKPWGEGIEQTAILTLLSPSGGAPLISGFGDIGGFVHDDLDRSPPHGMFTNPLFGNTNTLDFAERQPSVIVRSGRPHEGQAPLAYSEDGGRSWLPLAVSQPAESPQRRRRDTALIVSADGAPVRVMTQPRQVTRDRGRTWTAVQGLPRDGRPVAGRTEPLNFYALDFNARQIYTSTDGGATFAASSTSGLPDDI